MWLWGRMIMCFCHHKEVDWFDKKILVVDDEQSITDLVKVYLKSENYHVLKFYRGI